jgi:hypothetical protein
MSNANVSIKFDHLPRLAGQSNYVLLGWIITGDNIGAGPTIAQGAKTLGTKQTAFDAEIAAITEVLK